MAAGTDKLQKVAADSEVLQAGTFSSPSCLICATARTRRLFTKNGYDIFQCTHCKLEFLNPQPDDAVLASIYNDNYFLGDRDRESEDRTASLKSATACLYLDRLATVLSGQGARILEVGCGTGDFLLQARSRGFEVKGIEYSASAAEIANRRLGPGTVATGTLDSAGVPSEYFNAIVACDVIEHVRDPKSFLRRARASLQPGGLLFIATPSVDTWSHRWMGKEWMEYKVEHLFYFGESSLRLLLGATSFEPPVFYRNEKAVSFDYVYHHFQRYSVPFWTPFLASLRRLLPRALLYRHWKIAASGVVVIAHKASAKNRKEI